MEFNLCIFQSFSLVVTSWQSTLFRPDYVFLRKQTIQTKTQNGSRKTTATSFIASSISAEVNQTKVQNAAVSWNTKRIRMESSSSSVVITTPYLAHAPCDTIHHTKKPSVSQGSSWLSLCHLHFCHLKEL